MDISVIQNLVEKYTAEDIAQAEESLLIEGKLPFELDVADDAEALDVLSATTWIMERMESHEQTFDQAVQDFIDK